MCLPTRHSQFSHGCFEKNAKMDETEYPALGVYGVK